MPDYVRPTSVGEAVIALGDRPWTVIAGGTDLYPAHVTRPLAADLLDITGIEGLRGIAAVADGWRIGAASTWTDVVEADLPPLFDGLKAAAREVGGVQIQNVATVAGNLCNASPAADGVPALLSLDAAVELAGPDGTGRVPLAAFVTGNRRTMRRSDQLVTAIHVPRPVRDGTVGGFLKLGARRYLVISIAMAAGTLAVEDGNVAEARIAVGACSEVASRLPGLEADLVGRAVAGELGAAATAEHLAGLTPIDDVRASADYRRKAALVLVRRLLDRLGTAAGGTP